MELMEYGRRRKVSCFSTNPVSHERVEDPESTRESRESGIGSAVIRIMRASGVVMEAR